MAINSIALQLSVAELFKQALPAVDLIAKLGYTDFSASAPEIKIGSGQTVKMPLGDSGVADVFAKGTNDYLSSADPDLVNLTATHILSGHTVDGEGLDSADYAPRYKQIFAAKAGRAVGAKMKALAAAALDGATASTGVTLPATPTLANYMALATAKPWIDGNMATLVVNGAEAAKIKGVFAAAHLVPTNEQIAEFLGFRGFAVLNGMTARAAIVPEGCFGMLGRVPTIIANYRESGVEVDSESGLAIGIVVADNQGSNEIKVSADAWFGAACKSAPATAATAGVVKVGTNG